MQFRNFRNNYNRKTRIYSDDDLWNMQLKSLFEQENDIIAQNNQIGIPTVTELKASPHTRWVEPFKNELNEDDSAYWEGIPENQEIHTSTVNNMSQMPLQMKEKKHQLKELGLLNCNNEAQNISNIIKNNPNNILRMEQSIPDNNSLQSLDIMLGNPMTFEEAASEDINPAYFQDEYNEGAANNCQSCAVAYEARRRGYDVQAVERSGSGKVEELAKAGFDAWLDSTGKPCVGENVNANNAEELYDKLNNKIKQGERYAVVTYTIRDTDEGVIKEGHVEILDKDSNGKLRLYDPQSNLIRQEDSITGRFDAKADFTGQLPTQILRIDDKEFNPYYFGAVVRGRGR